MSSHDDDFLALAKRFFNPASAPLLHDYLQSAVEKIELFVDDDPPSIVFQLHLREGFYEPEWMNEWSYRYKCFAEPISESIATSLAIWGKDRGLEMDSSYRDAGWYIGFSRSSAAYDVEP